MIMLTQKLIRVQFKPVGKSYNFGLPDDIEVQTGDYVIVNTARGKQIGVVSAMDAKPVADQEIQFVERKATSRDLILRDMIKEKESEALKKAQEFLKKPDSDYEGVKALGAEFSFDSSRLTLYLSYDDVPNFNMRNFIREAAPMYSDCRLEIRQVGPRDIAKEISGLGACGIEKRCCSRFLTDFNSISIKMAKSQNVSLTPSEITGICGRLRCCLAYEHDNYEELRKNLPKVKKMIQTPLGEGKVTQVLPLTDSVMVYIPEVGVREIKRSELESGVMEEKAPIPIKTEEPLSTNEDVEIVRIDQNPRPGKAKQGSQNRQNRDKNRGPKDKSKYNANPVQNENKDDSHEDSKTTGQIPRRNDKNRPNNRKNKRNFGNKKEN